MTNDIIGIPASRTSPLEFSKGKITGIVNVIKTGVYIKDFKKGHILVGTFFNWDKNEYIPILKTAKAVITDEGGVTSHVAIECRKYDIPCVVGTKVATKLLKDGDEIEIDTDSGIIKKTSLN